MLKSITESTMTASTNGSSPPRAQRMRVAFQGDRGAYANFLSRADGPDRVRAAYPGATWDRLVEIKRRYDHKNLFRLNQNIPPTGQ